MKDKTALHRAAKAGDIEEVEKVIEEQAKEPRESGQGNFVDERDCTGWTALHWAASRGKDDIVALLIEKGCSVNAVTTDNWAPVHDAARSGSEECLRKLKAAEAEMHIKTTNGNTPLHLAAQYGRDAAVHLLSDCEGVDINEVNHLGHSAVHVAARHGHEAIVTSLIDKRANVLLLDRIGRNAQKLAQDNNHPAIAEILRAAAENQRGGVLNTAELALNAAEEALHLGDKALAKSKFEDAQAAFMLAGDEERAENAREQVAAVVRAMKQ